MRCEYARDDGAYVLGALSPAERGAYEHHLAGCESCRRAVAELAALPGLLRRLDVATAERVALDADTAPPSRLPRLLRAAEETRRRERLRRRWRVAVAGLAAACLAALVGVGAVQLRTVPAAPPPTPVAMAPMTPASAAVGRVTGEVGLAQVAGGTRVWLRCEYGETGETGRSHRPYTFRLVAYGTDGEAEQVASWKAGPGDDRSVEGVTRFAMTELDRLEVQRGDGRPVLVYSVA